MNDAFSLEENVVADTVILVAYGEVDAASAPALTQALNRHRATATTVVVDLRAVTFIDSTGLAALALNATERDGLAAVQLIAPVQPQPVRLLELTDVKNLFTPAPDTTLEPELDA